MPLTVCRCCGEKMEADQLGRNPNVCRSCEQLLEDDSPALMADIARIKSDLPVDKLLDQPAPAKPAQPSKRTLQSEERKK